MRPDEGLLRDKQKYLNDLAREQQELAVERAELNALYELVKTLAAKPQEK